MTWGIGSNKLTLNFILRSTPVQEFTSSTNWKKVVATGDLNSSWAALKTDGTLWVWGTNSDATLGLNDNIYRTTPVQGWTSSTNWKDICASRQHFFGLKQDGKLWGLGKIGSSATLASSTPVFIQNANTNIKKLTSGSVNNSLLYITQGGELFILENTNNANAFLDGTPIQEFTYSNNWKQVIAPSGNASVETYLGLKTDGTIWAWGYNGYNAFGRTSPSFSSSPLQESSSSTNWKFIATASRVNPGAIYAIKTGIEMDTGNLTS